MQRETKTGKERERDLTERQREANRGKQRQTERVRRTGRSHIWRNTVKGSKNKMDEASHPTSVPYRFPDIDLSANQMQMPDYSLYARLYCI